MSHVADSHRSYMIVADSHRSHMIVADSHRSYMIVPDSHRSYMIADSRGSAVHRSTEESFGIIKVVVKP